MELVCPHCQQALQFSGKRPTFCAYCGKALPAPAEALTEGAATAADETAAGGSGHGDDPAEIGGYRLLRRLGEGGMGRVYEAEEIASGRRVALKLIAARYAESPAAVERFRREGRLASGVAHPRCVFIFAADEAGGRPYIVMELMPGTTLQDLVEQGGPRRVEEAIARILDVIDGLRELHRLGIVHRDVKPSNCLLDADGRAKIGDFGLSRSLVRADALTRTGTFIGTPLFAAPEQIKAEAVGPRADVYSVAATLYYLLTGRAPFQGGNAAATLARIVSEAPPPMRAVRPELPAALDAVVRRGLERDPAKRWRNLDELEASLLPFVPGRLSIGGLGIRFGAFLIDYGCLILLTLPLALVVLAETARAPGWQLDPQRQLLQTLAGSLLWVLYFGGCEALWSCTLGKRWLGLRVRKPEGGDRPGLVAIGLRTILFYLLLNLGTLALQALLISGTLDPVDPAHPDPAQQMRMGMIVSALFYPLTALGIGLLCCTMRARNGYRGLHEVLSGTRVVRLPETGWCAAARPDQELPVSRPADLPARLGPFDVLGLLADYGPEQLLLAHDASLERRVWIWRRSSGAEPLLPARHALNRPTRLRWLAGGTEFAQSWDAFLAPSGGPLAAAEPWRCSWAEARALLDDLAGELVAARRDGTLPATLSVGHVWVRSDGRVALLDTAVGPPQAEDDLPPLALLAQTAVWALSLTPRWRGDQPVAVGAPLPRHANDVVGRLLGVGKPFADVEEFQQALAAVRDRPSQTTRPRRLAHLTLQATLFSLASCCGVFPAALIPSLLLVQGGDGIGRLEGLGARLAEVADRDAAMSRDADPARRAAALGNVAADAELRRALDTALAHARAEHVARSEASGWLSRSYAAAVEKHLADAKGKQQGNALWFLPPASAPDQVRWHARAAIAEQDDGPSVVVAMAVTQTIFLAVWPLLWVLWALAARGGLSLRLLGLALVRRDGRPARRVQCAWRALLVWLPVTTLAIGAVWLDVAYWLGGAGDAWLSAASAAACWAALTLVPVYVALALWLPVRSLHDRLAGTYVVPR